RPFARKGMRPGVSGLVDGGMNGHLCNATTENTPCNGVLTAVEDFLKETKHALRLVQVPGYCGLGILFPVQLPEQNEAFAKLIQLWDLPQPLKQYVQMLELNRTQLMANCAELYGAVRQLQARQ